MRASEPICASCGYADWTFSSQQTQYLNSSRAFLVSLPVQVQIITPNVNVNFDLRSQDLTNNLMLSHSIIH